MVSIILLHTGQFQHKFTTKGTFYVWSGFADQYEIKNYRMTINVSSHKELQNDNQCK